jgi:peptidoglycan/xylan/chitin deacetylase (PgdA/CDA1 family)
MLENALYFIRIRIAQAFHKKVFVVPGSKPIISFTFDDFPRSAYLVGGKLLDSYGIRGTYYLAMGLMNTQTKVGPQFTTKDLKCLVGDGHELGCHTFGHLDAFITPVARYKQSMCKNLESLQRLLPHVELETFSYPFGRITLSAKKVAGQRFACCRSIIPGINSGVIDLSMLSTISLYSRHMRLDQIRDLIWENSHVKGWLIFYTHDVCENPSAFGCTPEYLKEVVKWSVESGAEVLPVRAALEVLRARLAGI